MRIRKTNHLMLYIVSITRDKLRTVSSLGKMPVGDSKQQALCFWTSSYKITKKQCVSEWEATNDDFLTLATGRKTRLLW